MGRASHRFRYSDDERATFDSLLLKYNVVTTPGRSREVIAEKREAWRRFAEDYNARFRNNKRSVELLKKHYYSTKYGNAIKAMRYSDIESPLPTPKKSKSNNDDDDISSVASSFIMDVTEGCSPYSGADMSLLEEIKPKPRLKSNTVAPKNAPPPPPPQQPSALENLAIEEMQLKIQTALLKKRQAEVEFKKSEAEYSFLLEEHEHKRRNWRL